MMSMMLLPTPGVLLTQQHSVPVTYCHGMLEVPWLVIKCLGWLVGHMLVPTAFH